MLFMVTNRRIVNGRYSDKGKSNFKFEYQYAYNNKERGLDKFEKTGRKGFEAALLKELNCLKNKQSIKTPKIGIYLHGYNNNYQDSIDEIFDMERSLESVMGYSPVIVGFSWPSAGHEIHYLSDREKVRKSVGAFTRFLIDINEFVTRNSRNCFSTTFCIAHSMGNYLLRKGMEYLADELGCPTGRKLFDETVMLAPDLSSKDIEKNWKGCCITDFSRRVHVYYSKYDRALKASSTKRFGANRLGRHGVENYKNLRDNVVIIDAEKYANRDAISGCTDRSGEQVSVHSSHRYQKNILEDIEQVLSSIDRDLIKGREQVIAEGLPENNHYRLT